MNESQRHRLRARIDEAKRVKLDNDRQATAALRARTPAEIKRQAAARKAILAAQAAHDIDRDGLLVLGECEGGVYLVSVGEGQAHVLHLRERPPRLSDPEQLYTLLAGENDWTPFTGHHESIVVAAARLIDAGPGSTPSSRPRWQGSERRRRTLRLRYRRQQKAEARTRMVLDEVELDDLLRSLDRMGAGSTCDGSLRLTFTWAESRTVTESQLAGSLAEFGSSCDCEVLSLDPGVIF